MPEQSQNLLGIIEAMFKRETPPTLKTAPKPKPRNWFKELDPEVENYMAPDVVAETNASVQKALDLQEQLRGLRPNDPKYQEIADRLTGMGQTVFDNPKQILWNARVASGRFGQTGSTGKK